MIRCAICGKEIDRHDMAAGDYAEMYDPATSPRKGAETKVVHYECGRGRGWRVS